MKIFLLSALFLLIPQLVLSPQEAVSSKATTNQTVNRAELNSQQEETETKTDQPEKKPLSAKSQEVEDMIMKVIEKWTGKK
jgi:hypothetical protein